MTGFGTTAREDFVRVRCTAEEKARFKELAQRENVDVSTLIRRRVFAHVEEEPIQSGLFVQEQTTELSTSTAGPGWPE